MTLVLRFLGGVQAIYEGLPLKFATDHSRALLIYLSVEANRPHPRTSLATMLWPEESESAARQNLRQALVFLKQTLGPVAERDQLLQISSNSLQWTNQGATVDLHSFYKLYRLWQSHKQSAGHGDVQSCPTCLEYLTEAVNLYQGEFLNGFLLKQSQTFEEWSLFLREQSHRQLLEMLTVLTDYQLAEANYEQAAHHANRQINLEPWHEDAHRQLMLALAMQGQQGLALRQYENCRRNLQQELGVPPSAETTRLYEEIRAGKFDKRRRQLGDKKPGKEEAERRLPQHNLPLNRTPLVGRSQQLEQLQTLLHNPAQRLITIVGLGGMGKSRLSLALMEHLIGLSPPPYAHGVWFVPLTTVVGNSDSLSEGLSAAIFNAMGITASAEETTASALFQFLAQRQVLLILDNFEHLLLEERCATAATQFVLALLEATTTVSLVVTSRLPLQLLAESLVRLDGLPFPAGALLDKRDIANYDSVRLFLFHAQRTLPDFQLSDENISAIRELCQTLGGMPLAIELAAALTPHFTPDEMCTAIRQDIALLASSRRDLDLRHRQLSAVLHSSWQQLTEQEQQTLTHFALFEGTFSRVAAQSITGAGIEVLAALVEKSLVQQSGIALYQLHPLLRQFSQQQFAQLSTEQQRGLEARYVHYFLQLFADAYPKLCRRGVQKTIAQLRQASENCRRAWEIALEHRSFEIIDSSLAGWLRYWQMTGGFTAGGKLLANTLVLVENSPAINSRLVARLCYANAVCLVALDQLESAMQMAEKASRLSLEAGDVLCHAQAQALIATGYCLQNRHSDARPFAERAFLSQIPTVQIDALFSLAGLEATAQSQTAVIAQALQIAREVDDPYLILICTQHMAGSNENQGHYAASLPYRTEALQLAYDLEDRYLIGQALYLFGLVHAHLGLFEMALSQFQKALTVAQESGAYWTERRILNRLARTYYLLGEFDTAYKYSQRVQDLCRTEEGVPLFIDFNHAQILEAMGWVEEAKQVFQRSLLRKRANTVTIATKVLPELAALANLAVQQGDREAALTMVEEILHICTSDLPTFTPDLYFDEFAVDVACYRVLFALGDERAASFLETSYQKLKGRLEQISDPQLRASYLENVKANHELHLAYLNT